MWQDQNPKQCAKFEVTNTATTKAMGLGGKLVDARHSLTGDMIAKALVTTARCLSDIGYKKGQNINY